MPQCVIWSTKVPNMKSIEYDPPLGYECYAIFEHHCFGFKIIRFNLRERLCTKHRVSASATMFQK